MTDDFFLDRLDGPAMLAILDEVTTLYLAVYSDGPQGGSSSLYSREAFLDRTNRQVQRDGFAATTARLVTTKHLVGFSFGLTFPAGSWWAAHRRDDPPTEILNAPKFAVIELNVATSYRGRGLARRLLDLLLADRPESIAILTTTPDSFARSMYDRWGWQQAGTAQHTPEAPLMDQLILPLRGSK